MFVGVIGSKYKSLVFDGSTDYLSMADADFGAYTRTKFSVSAHIFPTSASTGDIFTHKDGAGNNAFRIYRAGDKLCVDTYHGADANQVIGNTTINTDVWTHIHVHIDPTNATSTDRIKCWVAGNAETFSSTDFSANSAINDIAQDVTIGGYHGVATFQGKIYQPAFFDNTLAPISSVYNSGPIRDISGVSGIYSLLQNTGANILNDAILASDWTNNGSVTISANIP